MGTFFEKHFVKRTPLLPIRAVYQGPCFQADISDLSGSFKGIQQEYGSPPHFAYEVELRFESNIKLLAVFLL